MPTGVMSYQTALQLNGCEYQTLSQATVSGWSNGARDTANYIIVDQHNA